MLNAILRRYELFRPFSATEAWGLFRLAAFAEAIGWAMLITGILIGKYLTPGNGIAVQIAGHTHGIFFLVYVTAVILLYPSQGWSRPRTLIAGLASVPPFGSLMFEQWASRQRRKQIFHRQAALITYNSLTN